MESGYICLILGKLWDLTRPSLQSHFYDVCYSEDVVSHDCFDHNLGAGGGIPSNNRDCARSRLAGLAFDFRNSLDREVVCVFAKGVDVRVGTLLWRSRIGLVFESEVRIVLHSLDKICFSSMPPTLLPFSVRDFRCTPGSQDYDRSMAEPEVFLLTSEKQVPDLPGFDFNQYIAYWQLIEFGIISEAVRPLFEGFHLICEKVGIFH